MSEPERWSIKDECLCYEGDYFFRLQRLSALPESNAAAVMKRIANALNEWEAIGDMVRKYKE